MAKGVLFRTSMFGYSKTDVHAFLERQNAQVGELTEKVTAMERSFDGYRRFYETLLRVSEDNLTLIRKMQLHAKDSDARAQKIMELFASVSGAYNELFELATAQNAQLALAKVYETKATRYDELARNMKALVLPEGMQTQETGSTQPLSPLNELPNREEFERLYQEALTAAEALQADCKTLLSASQQMKTPRSESQDAVAG